MNGSAAQNQSDEIVRHIRGLIGQRITRIRRIQFHHRGTVDESTGPFELTTAATGSVVFDAGPDGEILDLRLGPWRDPFEARDDDVSRMFIEEHGRWVARDVSGEPRWKDFIGHLVDHVEITFATHDRSKVVGSTVRVGGLKVKIEAIADELMVTPSVHES